MGKRSVKATKSGKFMNPTDQARKEARKKELKKNKKQRLLVRTSVLKNKDPGVIIEELDKLDEVEYNVHEPPQLAEKVLKDKRRKLKETLDRVMKLYQKEEPTYWNELKQIENDYERRRFHRIQFYEAVKQAEAVSNVEDIPLPPTQELDVSVPPPGPAPQPPLPEEPKAKPPGILKSVPVTIQGVATQYLGPDGQEPPGVPSGPPPEYSSSESDESAGEEDDDDGDEMEISLALPDPMSVLEAESPTGSNTTTDPPVKKSVRFEPPSSAMDEMDRFMKEVEQEFNSMKEEDLNPPGVETDDQPKGTAVQPPPPPPKETSGKGVATAGLSAAISAGTGILNQQRQPLNTMRPPPPYFVPGSRPFFPFPPPSMPGGPMSMPPPPPPRLRFTNNRFRQQPPRLTQQLKPPTTKAGETKIVSEAMIQAKPQIRSLSADVTRFVPVAVKTRREDQGSTKEWKPSVQQPVTHAFQKAKSSNKDSAYEDFMKEMENLL